MSVVVSSHGCAPQTPILVLEPFGFAIQNILMNLLEFLFFFREINRFEQNRSSQKS